MILLFSVWRILLTIGQYVPAAQESVIGVISQRQGESYRVDIGSAHMASLDGLAFEGATKRNKPNLRVSFIFCDRNSRLTDQSGRMSCIRPCVSGAQGHGT